MSNPRVKDDEEFLKDYPSSYNRQIIIDFDDNPEKHLARSLKFKWDINHPGNPCLIIKATDILAGKSPLLSKLMNKDDCVRLYVVAHGSPDNNKVFGDMVGHLYTYHIAKIITQFIEDKKIIVNLVSCGAGAGSKQNPFANPQNSIASSLHHEMANIAKRDIPVIARKQLMAISCDHNISTAERLLNLKTSFVGRKGTMPLGLSWHNSVSVVRGTTQGSLNMDLKQPGSKIIFCRNAKGNQVVIDAYYYLWKSRVLKILTKIKSATTNVSVKTDIQKKLDEFSSMSSDQIYNAINATIKELHDLGQTELPIYKILLPLLNERKRILSSEYTDPYPRITR